MAQASKLEKIASNPHGTKATASGLEGKLKEYNKSVAIGQLGGLAATAGATYLGANYPSLIANYIPGVKRFTDSALGLIGLGMVSNFIGDQIGFASSLYAFNKEKYRGITGKLSFLKDGFNLGIRHLGGYLVSYPLAAAASYLAITTGLLSGFWAVTVPYIIESVVTGLGYMASTLGYRKKQAHSYAT